MAGTPGFMGAGVYESVFAGGRVGTTTVVVTLVVRNVCESSTSPEIMRGKVVSSVD